MEVKVITDNAGERIKIGYEDERYSLTHLRKPDDSARTTTLNKREALEIAQFILERENNERTNRGRLY